MVSTLSIATLVGMSGVMIEGALGPREVAPEAMWVGLTRPGLAMTSWQGLIARTEEGFLTQEDGIWLPTEEQATVDFENVQAEYLKSAPNELFPDDRYGASREALSKIALTETGCWVAKIEDPAQTLIDLTETDTKHGVLEGVENVDLVRKCQTPNCLYHRHYDFTPGVPSERRALLYPDLGYFKTTGDEILTAWGDRLPPVQESREALREFQLKCMPFVPRDESLLTLGGISQINLIPDTGCWFVRSYYMTPVGVNGYANWQYDGYGRLRIPSSIADRYDYKSYAILAHRVTWALTGHSLSKEKDRVLNHRCGFRPCANPGHLEEVDADTNILHGYMMSTAVDVVEGRTLPGLGAERIKKYAAGQAIDIADIDRFWENVL